MVTLHARDTRMLALALSLGIAMVEVSCRSSSDEREGPPAPTPVRCEAVAERMVQTQVQFRGAVAARPNEDVVVSSAVSGRIVSIHVVEGDSVAKGALLAVVENPSLVSDQETAAAQVVSAQAALENAEQALERERRLFDQDIAARRAVEDAEARAASAKAELTAARAQQRLAAQQSARAQLRAPIAGTVVKVMRGTGELVDGTPATPVVEVANTSVLELSCDVASADLVRIDEGVAAQVRLDALPDRSIDGKVARIAPTVDATTSLGRVRIALAPPAALASRLQIGMAGAATVATGARQALVVLPSALRRSQDGQDQVLVCAQHEGATLASAVDVTVGARSDTWVEITSGPPVGTRVVADRVLGLEDGTRIAPQKPDGSGEPTQ